MKTINTILYIIITLLVFVAGFLLSKEFTNYEVPRGKILVSTEFFDSINALRPDTIITHDTVVIEKIIYKDRKLPEPEPTPDPEINLYEDSLINQYAKVKIKDWIKGEIVDRNIEYTPYITKKTIREPYPVIIERTPDIPKKTPKFELFTGVVIEKAPGIELGITSKKYYISSQYNGTFSLTIGRKFRIY
jgi:hypothetical protein